VGLTEGQEEGVGLMEVVGQEEPDAVPAAPTPASEGLLLTLPERVALSVRLTVPVMVGV
jgi:hypothetical protein